LFHLADVFLVKAGGNNFDLVIDNLQTYFNVAFNIFNYGFMQWGYSTMSQTMTAAEGTQNMVLGLPRGKALGGTHSINAAACVQVNEENFDHIADELKIITTGNGDLLGIVKLGRDKWVRKISSPLHRKF
jgi:choline dehydrogenase-like flavoprotein